jgi:hypothetical protein
MTELEHEPEPLPQQSYVARLARELSLTRTAVHVLASCGVSTPEELLALARAFPALSHFVDLPLVTARVVGSLARHSIAAQPRTPRKVARSAFGAAYPRRTASAGATKRTRPPPGAPGWRVPIPRAAPQSLVPKTLPDVLLDEPRWSVRNQGDRGTCVVQAVCAKLEWSKKGAEPLSPQFLFWAVKNRGHDPFPDEDGTLLKFAAKALAADGVCRESSHPYSTREIMGDPGHRVAPPKKIAVAEAARRAVRIRGATGRAAAIVRKLIQGQPVAVSLPVFVASDQGVSNWDTDAAWDYGAVLDPPPSLAAANEGHAVALVGFRRDPQKPGGGVFILRNSWGEDWGASLPDTRHAGPRPGYGTVSVAYVEKYAWEVYSL